MIKKIQNRLLYMAKETCNILEKHDIPYMLTLGTLLGAVRHKGFIPWDDDFDIHLFSESYNEAIKVLRKELPENLFLEDEQSEPLFFHGWAHIKDLKSRVDYALFPQDGVYSHHGLQLDLYKLNRIKKSDVMKFINDENEAYIQRRWEKGLISDNEYKNRLENLEANRKKEKEPLTDEKDCDVYGMISVYRKKYISIDDIFPLAKYRFEDRSFYGPRNADKILREIYGEYMTLPPESERMPRLANVEMW